MTAKIRTLIVDDEPLALKLLAAKLSKIDDIEIVGQCKNGREAINSVVEMTPDLMFLDIQMPGMNGLEVVQAIQSDVLPIIVFATAYEQYAIDAFNANAVDYILKPIDNERIERAVHRASQRLEVKSKTEDAKQALIGATQDIQNKNLSESTSSSHENTNQVISPTNTTSRVIVKDRDEIHIIEQEQIQWIDAAGDYACIHSNGETLIKRITLKELIEELDPTMFKRVHRSTIVNLKAITKVLPRTKGEFFLQLGEHEKVKVSRNYKEVVKDFLAS